MKKVLKLNLLVFLALFIWVSTGYAQKQKNDSKKVSSPNTAESKNDWKPIIIEKLGVKSINFPEDFRIEKKSLEENVKSPLSEDLTYSLFQLHAKRSFQKAKNPQFTVILMVSKYNEDYAKAFGLSKDEAIPENMVSQMIKNNRELKNIGEESLKADFHEVDGFKGSFYLRKAVKGEERLIEWKTYRFFEGKLHLINLALLFPSSEMDDAMKILNSLQFSK